jgi:hypothetical protein
VIGVRRGRNKGQSGRVSDNQEAKKGKEESGRWVEGGQKEIRGTSEFRAGFIIDEIVSL